MNIRSRHKQVKDKLVLYPTIKDWAVEHNLDHLGNQMIFDLWDRFKRLRMEHGREFALKVVRERASKYPRPKPVAVKVEVQPDGMSGIDWLLKA